MKSGHREDYERLRSQCANPSWVSSTLARLNKTADSDTYAWEKRWRINRIVANDRGIQSVDFGAWDFLRVAMLTRAGAGLGWLSEDEAWDTLALVNRALDLSYSSWNEVWDAFRTTRWLWAAEGKAQEATNDLHERPAFPPARRDRVHGRPAPLVSAEMGALLSLGARARQPVAQPRPPVLRRQAGHPVATPPRTGRRMSRQS